jgi:thiamine-phosphate diphosphorylase
MDTTNTPLRRERLARLRGLYAIVGDSARSGPARPPLELVAAFARGGAAVVQLRLKRTATGELLRLARAAVELCRAAGALLLVNDRPDVAALAGADGVHLGQEDLPVEAARAVLGPEALIGVSTHSDEEIARALAAGADYLGFGPVFATDSKEGATLPPPHSVEGLSRTVKLAGRVPVVAIGGITVARARSVALAGAACAAAIAELCNAPDPEARARAFAEALR